MCLTKVYYNTYSDGAQDITEKTYPCPDGRPCPGQEVRKYDRKFPFTKLGKPQPESHRSLSERKPTPYFPPPTPRGSKSPYRDPYGYHDSHDHHRSSSRRDPRDRHDSGPREPRLKRSSTAPHIVYVDRDQSSRPWSRSGSRDYSRHIPVGFVPLADEYGRRRSSRSRSRSRDGARGEGDRSGLYYRRRTDEPLGYVLVDDEDERRRQRRQQRRMSTSSYAEPSSSAAAADGYDPRRYMPRRASTVVHRSDGSVSASRPKQLRWEDEVRAKRERRQDAETASRPAPAEPKGILKKAGDAKGKARDLDGDLALLDDIAELERAVRRMDVPRGRDREPRAWDGWDAARGWYDDGLDRDRRKRSKLRVDSDRYKYR